MIAPAKQAFKIIPTGWRDLKVIHTLEKACFNRDAYPYLELLGLLTLPGFVCYKAEISGEVIGFVAGEKRAGKGTGWVVTVCVRPAFRRQGIARQMIAVCEEEMNRKKVCLCVRKTNQPAIQLYQRLGYQIIKTRARYYDDGEDALVMEKQR
jgi:[ribosomal protein S18]-alanine N-acetyltransferase